MATLSADNLCNNVPLEEFLKAFWQAGMPTAPCKFNTMGVASLCPEMEMAISAGQMSHCKVQISALGHRDKEAQGAALQHLVRPHVARATALATTLAAANHSWHDAHARNRNRENQSDICTLKPTHTRTLQSPLVPTRVATLQVDPRPLLTWMGKPLDLVRSRSSEVVDTCLCEASQRRVPVERLNRKKS